jgi:hypothetical protein
MSEKGFEISISLQFAELAPKRSAGNLLLIPAGGGLKLRPLAPSTYGKGGTGGNLSRKNWAGKVVGGV